MYALVNGTRLWFDVEGAGLLPDGPEMRERPTIVLVHGGPASYDHSYLKPDFGRLASVAQVVYLDLRDHGRSDRADPADWSFERCADDVRAFCDALGVKAPIVVGHSMGGFVAMLYGSRHPDHAGALALVATNARFDLERLVEGFRAVGGDEVAEIAERGYGQGFDRITDEEWERCRVLFGPWVPGTDERSRILRNAELGLRGVDLLRRFDARDDLALVECPTLVCVGELDPVTPVAAALEIMEALPPELARLEVIRDAGHFPWKDAPDRFWPLLEEHVLEAKPPS